MWTRRRRATAACTRGSRVAHARRTSWRALRDQPDRQDQPGRQVDQVLRALPALAARRDRRDPLDLQDHVGRLDRLELRVRPASGAMCIRRR